MRRSLLAIATFLTTLAAPAAPVIYKVRPIDSTVAFTIVKLGVFREHGRFPDTTGRIVVYDEQPERSSVEIQIATSSVDTGVSGRDSAIRSEGLLHTSRFPRMTFVSREVKRRDGTLFDVTGDLTIRGVTRRVTIPVRLAGRGHAGSEGEVIAFESTFTVDRADYGVGGTSGVPISRELEVRLSLAAGR